MNDLVSTPPEPLLLWRLIDRAFAGVVAVAIGFAVAGVPLAIAGWFRPLAVTGAISAVALVVLFTRGRRPFIEPTPNAPLIALVIAIGVITAWNVVYSSEHFATDRDPAIYATTALAVADEGDLLPTGSEGPFIGVSDLHATGPGFLSSPNVEELHPQFAHLTTILHATAVWIGGLVLLTKLNALITAAALLAFFALARMWMSPWIAVAATTALGLTLPELHVARDAFSEPIAQLLMIAGTAELTAAWRTRRIEHAIAGGLLLGALTTARVDGLVLLGPMLALAAAAAVAGRRGAEAPWRSIVGGVVAAAVTTTIGVLQLRVRSPLYFIGVWSEVRLALVLAAIVAIGSAVIVGAWPAIERIAGRLLRHQRKIGAAAALAVVAALQALWFIRPNFEEHSEPGFNSTAVLQAAEGVAVDGTRNYAEATMVWLEWYVGPITLALAIIGAGLATWKLIAHGRVDWLAPLLLLGTTTAAYLWRPSITPDQIWAMRRFVPQSFPLVMLLAFTAIDHLRAKVRHGPVLAGLLAMAAIGPILAVALPLRAMKTDRLTVDEIERVCDAVGPDAALVVVNQQNSGLVFTNPLRFACDVPAVFTREPEEIDWSTLAAEWAAEGRELRVLIHPDLETPAGEVQATVVLRHFLLERTIERRPENFDDSTRTLEVRVVPTD